ncbi:MAG: DUF2071 domain-containing protein [Chthonomonadales bacterium]
MIDRIAPTIRPNERPVMYQNWSKLLFIHWVIPVEVLRPLIPPSLEIDTFDGQAYIGLVPFTMTGIRPKGLPSFPPISDFHEVNVRTYVHYQGQNPGVWFFSLDAANLLAVKIARGWFHLPYNHAKMSLSQSGNEIDYRSERLPDRRANCKIKYRIEATPAPAKPDTLDHFLVERYILYTENRGRLVSGQVNHTAYPAQGATLLEFEESLIAANGIARPDAPPETVHYAEGVKVEIFGLKDVAAAR